MTEHVEVFADITCPFTHVGLKRVVDHLARVPDTVEVHVRAWPLEWVNGEPLDPGAVAMKAGVLRDQLGIDDFPGFDPAIWPVSTIPALNLAAEGYERDHATGLAVSLDLRRALFEEGRDVGDAAVLAGIAADHGLAPPPTDVTPAVQADYEAGVARGVIGSPHFWCRGADFFCPALDIGLRRRRALPCRPSER